MLGYITNLIKRLKRSEKDLDVCIKYEGDAFYAKRFRTYTQDNKKNLETRILEEGALPFVEIKQFNSMKEIYQYIENKHRFTKDFLEAWGRLQHPVKHV